MALVYLSSQTASSDSSIDFTSGIDSTYNEYLFTIVNYKPVTDEKRLCFQVDTGTNTNYNQNITSSAYYAGLNQDASWTLLEYSAHQDQANSDQALQSLSYAGESNSNSSMTSSGQFRLFAPSNGTYVKHFTSEFNCRYTNNGTDAQTYSINSRVGGYINTTTAITRVRFAAISGNIYTGKFTLYGVT